MEKRKTLPADVPLIDGTIVRIENFQAKTFADATQQAVREAGANADGIEISMRLLTRIAMMQVAGYKAGDAQAHLPLTMDDLDQMDQSDILTLLEYLNPTIEVTKTAKENGTTEGVLPSGKRIEIRRAKGADLRKAGKMNGEQNRVYSMISLTCFIDDEQPDFVQVQLLDGLDFLAINTHLNSRPT